MATHSSILARKIPRTEEPGHKVAKSQTQLKQFSSHTLSIYWTLTMPQTLYQHVSRLNPHNTPWQAGITVPCLR